MNLDWQFSAKQKSDQLSLKQLNADKSRQIVSDCVNVWPAMIPADLRKEEELFF